MAGEWLTATANTNMFTYEIAPVFILMEHECLRKMREIIGFDNGDSILAPGGSISNMYALMIARHKLYPQHKAHGMRAIKGQLIMYTSKHVSILRISHKRDAAHCSKNCYLSLDEVFKQLMIVFQNVIDF